MSIGKATAFGSVVSILMSVLLAIILATLVSKENIAERKIGYITPVIVFLSVLSGCFTAAKISGEKFAIVAGVTGALYLFVIMGTGILFFNGGFHNIWTSVLATVVGYIVTCAMCIRGKGVGFKRKKLYG